MSRKDAAIEHLHELLALANERSQGLSDQLQQATDALHYSERQFATLSARLQLLESELQEERAARIRAEEALAASQRDGPSAAGPLSPAPLSPPGPWTAPADVQAARRAREESAD